MSALDELLRSDLVRHTDVPRRFRFRHPLVRRAVYDASPAGWRLGAHQRSAEALVARGTSAAGRAPHVERSARHGDDAAIATLREAGDLAAPRTPATAARWFGAALRLLSDAGPDQQRIELLTALAAAQAATGQFTEARTALLAGIELLPTNATTERVRLTTACAGVEHLLGRHKAAHARLEAALLELPDGDSREAAELTIQLVMDSLYAMDYDAMRTWAERAREAARPLGNRALTAATLAVSAAAAALRGATTEAQEQRELAAILIDHLSDEEAREQARRPRPSRDGGVVPRSLSILACSTPSAPWQSAARRARETSFP